MPQTNVYEDKLRAMAYAKMEFPATYYLAYRDLPQIIVKHVQGRKALDFGCGAGRSTRFLRSLGFDVTGIDISREMIRQAHEIDPDGDYRLMAPGDFSGLNGSFYDLVLSAFAFDNIPTQELKVQLFTEFRKLLYPEGKIVNLVSAPEIYFHEWVSFSTKNFPENRIAKSGEKVKIVITAIDDERPVEDTLWFDEDYRNVYKRAGLSVLETCKPLANEDEPFPWINETKVAPWTIYVLQSSPS